MRKLSPATHRNALALGKRALVFVILERRDLAVTLATTAVLTDV